MPATLAAYGWLASAIVCEVLATTLLQKSEQFTRLLPTLAMAGLYAVSFYCLAQSLRGIPLGVAYAIWGALGIVLTAVIGVVVFRQVIDAAALIGIGLIVSGVVVVNLFSHSGPHGS